MIPAAAANLRPAYPANPVNKYGAIKANGFDSRKEANRYAELKLLERAGKISRLQRQVDYTLIPSQYIDGKCVERACKYIADFVYMDADGNWVVEDTKGFKTKDYIIKRKLMLYVNGIRIKEI